MTRNRLRQAAFGMRACCGEEPMRYRDWGETRKRQIRYGAWAVAVVVVAAGLISQIGRASCRERVLCVV